MRPKNPLPAEPAEEAEHQSEKDHYFVPYLEHSKTLRTWFVAYGIGGPILFATQKSLIEKIIDYGCIKLVVILLLFGTLLQIIATGLAKTTTYQFYLSELEASHEENWLHIRARKLSDQYYWLLPTIDFITIALFVWATILVFLAWS